MDQRDWRFCGKCEELFFDGFPDKGKCPAGGGHEAHGFNFVLPHDQPESPDRQGAWRFCGKCHAMFFDGFPDKGTCPAGGGHDAQGFVFVLPHDQPEGPDRQGAWRFCGKCHAMFFDGFPTKGVCPTGGGHDAQGFVFVLPHEDDSLKVFDTGPVASDLPLGGSGHLVVTNNGAWTFSSHAHDSGFDNINYTLAAALMTPSGLAFTWKTQGHVEGTVAGLPFGTPNRNDDQSSSGSNPAVRDEFDRLGGASFVGRLAGTDTLVGGVEGLLDDALKTAAQELGKAGAAAVIALL
jgi:hypothetical protein